MRVVKEGGRLMMGVSWCDNQVNDARSDIYYRQEYGNINKLYTCLNRLPCLLVR
jgi:hypothetical protein